MAKKIPLVLYSNEPGQLQAGDYIGDESYISLTNGESTSVVIGSVVYISAADAFKKANAAAAGTMSCIGLVADTSIATATAGNIQAEGIIKLTTAQWDAVAGTTGGLTFNTKYYVSNATAGSIMASPGPLTGFAQRVGTAISTTEMRIELLTTYQL